MKKLKNLLIIALFLFVTSNITKAMELEIEPTSEPFNPNGGFYNNPQLKSVEKSFNNLIDDPVTIGANNPGLIKYPDYIYSANDNDWGINNHFQGMVRFPSQLGLNQYFAISGSNPGENGQKKKANLFIIKINSENQEILVSNIDSGKPNKKDIFIQNIVLDNNLYHAGGMQTCGKYLAVPIEGSGNGRVWFYECSQEGDKLKVQKVFSESSDRLEVFSTNYNAGAVAFIKLPNGYYLVGIWSDKDGLILYKSKKTYLRGGFEKIAIIPSKTFNANKRKLDPQYQMINFVQSTKGKLYLIGTENLSDKAPIINGKNIADLFEVIFDETKVSIKYKATKKFRFRPTSNFDATCTFYVPNSKNMFLYSCHHFLTEHVPGCCYYFCCCFTKPDEKTFLTMDQYTNVEIKSKLKFEKV